MTTKTPIDDVGEAIREDRPLRPAEAYRVQYAAGGLDFNPLLIHDPVPLGRQLLEAAGVRALASWSLLAILPSGDFEDVRLDEPFDLRGRGVERFVGFETDRLFRATLADRQLLWGRPSIAGAELYALAEPGKGEGVFVDVPGGTDRLIRRDETVDLTAPGVERFVIGPLPVSDVFEICPYTHHQTLMGGRLSRAACRSRSPLVRSPFGDSSSSSGRAGVGPGAHAGESAQSQTLLLLPARSRRLTWSLQIAHAVFADPSPARACGASSECQALWSALWDPDRVDVRAIPRMPPPPSFSISTMLAEPFPD